MSLYPLAFQLNSLVCLHLLCLLLLVSFSSSRLPNNVAVPAKPPTELNTTQANCSTACGVSDVQTIPLQKPDSDQSLASSNTVTPVSQHFYNTTAAVILTNQSAGGNHSSTTSPSNQQPVLPDPQLTLPEMGTHPVPFPPTGSLSQAAQTGSITTTSSAQPEMNVDTAIALVTSTDITMPISITTASTTPTARQSTITTTATTLMTTTTTKSSTTTHTSQNATVISTTTCTKRTPPNTGIPTINTITAYSAISPTNHIEPVTLESHVAVAEVAGATLTKHLVDKASLFALLLFGLLFFLVAVAVFITQAYESYRRKDYTQVDYLINGMYSDSGV